MAEITFIGGGNMASALAGGLCASGVLAADMVAVDPDSNALARISQAVPGIGVSSEYTATENADVVVLAVKPQVIAQASEILAKHLGKHEPLIVSIAAGITLKQLHQWLGKERPIVRCMPNTPALLRHSITALSCAPQCGEQQRQRAQDILGAVGTTVWCDEAHMDAVTAVSGSGPAYFFLATEALIDAGRALGLPDELARQLSTRTVLGAAHMINQDGADIVELRTRVTSPGGTTERALEVLRDGGFEKLWMDAVKAAAKRSKELTALLEQKGGTR